MVCGPVECLCVCVCVCVCVHVPAVCAGSGLNRWVLLCVCVCVCVWQRKRDQSGVLIWKHPVTMLLIHSSQPLRLDNKENERTSNGKKEKR